jgi:DNA-binding SARP family transcriptional activator
MEFHILGPLEVVDGGQTLELGGKKQRTLLAVLLLEANRVVSSDRLIETVWEGEPPETARNALYVYISELRRLLGKSRVETRAPGYRLLVEPDELDLNRFRKLHDVGRYAEALSLWRGPPLAEFAYQRFAETETAHLDELRLACLEGKLESELAAGRHAELVGELDALAREHPLRERLRALQMLALYRAGRQAEALEVYEDARRLLSEDLGLEPGRKLRELQRAILVHDPSLESDARPATDRPLAPVPGAPAFVGRESELVELSASLEEALAGRGRLVLIGGEPGVGKSRLAERLAGEARKRGFRVLVGRCWEAGGAPAFWPWIQALRAYVRETEPAVLRNQLGTGAPELAQLLPELNGLLPGLPEPIQVDSEGARFRLFDAAAEFLLNACVPQPIMIGLDDLHAGDVPTLLLLQFLARQLTSSRLLLVAAYRDVDPIPGEPLAVMLAEVAREPATHRIALGGLSKDEVAEYVELVAPANASHSLVTTLHERTEGNPLFVVETVSLLADETGRTDRSAIPQTVRDVIARRLARLPKTCHDVLGLASVLGREFELDALVQMSGNSEDEVLAMLDEATVARVVTDIPGESGRVRFGHVLIRDTLYDDVAAHRRAQLHRRAVAALDALHADDPGPHLTELAHHAIAGNDFPAGLDYARRAGDRAASLFAFEEAVRLYETALALTDEESIRCDLLIAIGDARARAGDTPAAKAAFREAADLAAARGLSDSLARAALGYGGRVIWDAFRDDPDLAPLLESALSALGSEDSDLRARVLARLAAGPLRDSTADARRRRSLGEEALAMARRIGDPSTLAYGLLGYISSHHAPDFTLRQLECAKELVEAALQAGDLERAIEGYEVSMESQIELADTSTVRADLEAMSMLAEELRQPAQRWVVSLYHCFFALLEGRFDEAEQLIAETRSLGERAQTWTSAATYVLQLYLLRREQGRAHEVEDLVHRAAADSPTYPVLRCARVDMLVELGSTAEVRSELDALAPDGFGCIPFDEEWTISVCFLTEAAVRLADARSAAALYRLLLPYADRVSISYTEISLGPVARYLGCLAAATGRWDEADRHFSDALEICERIGARPWLAHTREDYGRMLLRRGQTDDRTKARGLLSAAAALYRDCGMDAHAQRASKSAD